MREMAVSNQPPWIKTDTGTGNLLHVALQRSGGRGGIRTDFGSFFNFHYPATTTSLPEANSLITNERQ
jgi:hypothetical protein